MSGSADEIIDGEGKAADSVPAAKTAAPPSHGKPPSSILDRLPPWATGNLRSSRSWKTWFRCWLAAWIALLLLLPHKSLATLGNSAFFTVIVSLLLPPNLPFQMFIFMATTMMVGELLAWGIGSAAMRASVAARSKVLLASSLQKVAESAAGYANPEAVFQAAVFRGEFLDPRSSVVYGVFLAFGTFVFGLMRAYQPKLVFVAMFGTITLDIFCCFGVLFPFGEYTLLNSLLTSAGCYIAMATVVTVLVFPQSMNHLCLNVASGVLEKLTLMIKLQEQVLAAKMEDLAPGTPLANKIFGLRAATIGGIKQFESLSTFINLEFSFGKWNGEDIRELHDPLVATMVRAIALQSFGRLLGSGAPDILTRDTSDSKDEFSQASSVAPRAATHTKDSHLLQQLQQRNGRFEAEHGLTLQSVVTILEEATRDLRSACAGALGAMRAVVDCVNHGRWSRSAGKYEKCIAELDHAEERLQSALQGFKENRRFMLMDPFMPFLQNTARRDAGRTFPLRSLYFSYVFATNLMAVAQSLLSFVGKVRQTVRKRPRNTLWAPKELRALAKLGRQRGDRENIGDEMPPQEDPAEEQDEARYRCDPDSKPPKNIFQKLGNVVYALWQWTGTPEALYVFKYVVLTICVFLVAVFPNSAAFFYEQRGVWALIMAQQTLTVYASDQILSGIGKLLGTFAGLLVALITWYIGNGSGYNAYGLATSGAIFLAPIVWCRLYLPPAYLQSCILFCVTFTLIIGYSLVDAHLAQVGSPGVGWSVAWRRWTLVVIGSAVSFILMCIPPVSGRRAVRIRNSFTVQGLSNLYSFLIAHWIDEESYPRLWDDGQAPANWVTDFRMRLLTLADEIGALKQMTGTARWEGNLRGAWPAEEYDQLVNTEQTMLAALALLGGSLGQLSDDWRKTFIHENKILNPNFIGDVMSLFSLVAQSLRTGQPMHQVLPQSLLERLFYHQHSAALRAHGEHPFIDVNEIRSVDYMYYAAGVVAVFEILKSLDQMHVIVKRLCGEVPLRGFARWRELYERDLAEP